MKKEGILNVKSLKEQVYEYLRDQINKHNLEPGSAINMDATSRKLGISKTPLRDALIQLETEGFVTIAARRGIYVNPLTLEDVKYSYQVIGALESSAVVSAKEWFDTTVVGKMDRLNREMQTAIEKNNFNLFYKKNLDFHSVYIELSHNPHLKRIVDTLKKRLYDFPRQKTWIKEWEQSSIQEHQKVVDLLGEGKFQEAANHIRDVHWSYQVQERFILMYYQPL